MMQAYFKLCSHEFKLINVNISVCGTHGNLRPATPCGAQHECPLRFETAAPARSQLTCIASAPPCSASAAARTACPAY